MGIVAAVGSGIAAGVGALGAGAAAIGGALGTAGIGAAITGAAGLASSAISGSAAKDAATTQANAETTAAQLQAQQFQQTYAGLSPYNTTGQAAAAQLQSRSPFDFQPTQAQLEATPGYQFNLSQGLKSTQNSYAAQGLGTSGAALKGAATYASGLADTTYQNQFTNALNSYNTNTSTLQGQASLGENAAAMTGNYGTQTAQAIGSTAVGAANATAAGTIGSAQASAQGLGSLSYLGNNLFGAAQAPSTQAGIYQAAPQAGYVASQNGVAPTLDTNIPNIFGT